MSVPLRSKENVDDKKKKDKAAGGKGGKEKDHILTRWVTENTFDVYPATFIADALVGRRLLNDPEAIESVQGTVVDIKWDESLKPSPAILLDVGRNQLRISCICVCQRQASHLMLWRAGTRPDMEKKRTVLGRAAAIVNEALKTSGLQDAPCCTSRRRVDELEVQNQELRTEIADLKLRLGNSCDASGASKMVKRLKRMIDTMEVRISAGTGVDAPEMVDIGGGTCVEKSRLTALKGYCEKSPGRYARALMKMVFTKEELQGRSLFGKKCNVKKDVAPKEALDFVRVNAVVGYTCSQFSVNALQVKQSLASMLAREYGDDKGECADGGAAD